MRESSVAEQRYQAVLAVISDGLSISQVGETAVELIGGGDADIVLMDIHMPGMGGIEAARQIHSARPDLMVVLMSTYDVGDISADAADCGATAYLHKERLSPDLLSRIGRTGG
jgi:two-component system, NarL family, invasion response regulator UvrY